MLTIRIGGEPAGALRALLASSALLFPILALAAELQGHVVGVHDGDSITLLSGSFEVRIRLADIDAPELAQAFGRRSKESLSDLCFDKPAELTTQGNDRYGRTIARVYCSGVDA